MGFSVAIVGATGLVGTEFLKILDERNFQMESGVERLINFTGLNVIVCIKYAPPPPMHPQ